MSAVCLVGTAGWGLPRDVQHEFGGEGSHLQRYATRLPCAEINSSFHREHKETIWRRWADAVPSGFRFSAKLPKAITHERRLAACDELLEAFFRQVLPLAAKLDCVLVQLPPSLAFAPDTAARFVESLRLRWAGNVALEPRHASWFTADADALLVRNRVARVLADPVRFAAAAAPGGWPGLVYLRLHGSPRVYYSGYDDPMLQALAARIDTELRSGRTVWCIFDNTASGAATHDALTLQRLLRPA